MSNPVDVITNIRKTNEDNYRFPSTLGSPERGEDKFTSFLVKEIQKGGSSKTVGTVALPMPTDVIDDYKVEYLDAELGPIGASAVGMGTNIADDYSLENVGATLKSGLKSVNKSLISQVVSRKAMSMIPGISTGDAKATAGQIVTSATNRAVNPYITGVFKSVGFKTFNFTFRLHPLNRADTESMRKVINFFKSSMLPEDEVIVGGVDNHHGDFTYEQKTGLQKLPHRFDIDFHTGNFNEVHNFMVKIRDASITSFSVDYNTEGAPAFFKDTSAPMMAVLNMTFSESKIHTRERDDSLYDYGMGDWT